MGSDCIANDAIPGFSKDIIAKKKRTNRLAKLKQSKLDVRREQWLSQVKNKGAEVVSNGWDRSPSQFSPVTDEVKRSSKNLEPVSKQIDVEGSNTQESEIDSPLSGSPVGSSNISGSSCSSSGSWCCFSSVSEMEDDDGCLDDWEALADALTSKETLHDPKFEPPAQSATKTCLPESLHKSSDIILQEKGSKGMMFDAQDCCRAWQADDTSRPQSLPNVLKQNSLSTKSRRGGTTWACQKIVSQPSSCPICYEDLDMTDSCFFPCPCGFRLCLFCHKRILEADGRCPGCRKQYDHIKVDLGFEGINRCIRIGRSVSISIKF